MVQMQSWPGWQLISTASREFILCGEAPSHRGCRHSGIAFTSEYLLWEGIPRIPPMSHRLTIKKSPYKEGSATTVWKVLYSWALRSARFCGTHFKCILMNWEDEQSNRTPIPEEVIKFGEPALQMLVKAFPSAIVVAVGKIAERSLKTMGIVYKPVRHPALVERPNLREDWNYLWRGDARANCG